MKLVLVLCLSFLISVAVNAQGAKAEDVPSLSEYRESDIGINYRAIAEPPVDVILSHGEVEFFKNAPLLYGDHLTAEELKESWEGFAPEIGTGSVAKITVDVMKELTPNMLTSFGVLLDPNDPKYGLLFAYGAHFIAESFLRKE